MKPALLLILLLISAAVAPTPAYTQEPDLRTQAVLLLEKANSVSMAPDLPNLERTDTFHVSNPDSRARDGSFSRVVIQGVGRREETTFGDYHLVSVWQGNTLKTTRSTEIAPAEVVTVMRLTPIYLVRLDQADVVKAILDKQIDDLPAHCIEFETIVGQSHQQNEICVDAYNGTIVMEKLGNRVIENRGFFSFAGALVPSSITLSSLDGGPQLEISQTMAVLDNTSANVLAAPPDATTLRRCTTYRRAIGQSMPQPLRGNGETEVDIVVRGVIGTDGKVHDALVQNSERTDLNPEALSVVSQWVFSPPMCDGKPNSAEASFVLHFYGR